MSDVTDNDTQIAPKALIWETPELIDLGSVAEIAMNHGHVNDHSTTAAILS